MVVVKTQHGGLQTQVEEILQCIAQNHKDGKWGICHKLRWLYAWISLVYTRVELLGHRICVSSPLSEYAKAFSNEIVPICNSSAILSYFAAHPPQHLGLSDF